MQLVAEASDPDDPNRENLSVEWEATAGVIATSTHKWFKTWVAPPVAGLATISIRVTDKSDLEAVARVCLKVGSGVQPANQRPVVSNLRTTGNSGQIQLTYNLADQDQDEVSLQVDFSLDGGENFIETTSLLGSTSQVLPGSDRELTWLSAADIADLQSQVVVRITPADAGGTGTAASSAVFTVNNSTTQNQLPVISNLVVNGSSGDIRLDYTLADADNEPCSIEVTYSIDGGSTFNTTTSLTGSTTAVVPGSRSITWNSAANIAGNQSNVVVRITPRDAVGNGTAATSAVFAVNNNNLPTVSAVSATGSSGNITLAYTLADPNGDLCTIGVFYSIDGGTTYTATTNVTGTLTSVAPGSGKTLTWNSAADIPGNQSAVRVRIVANDGSGAGTPGESTVFAVSNNALPVVSNITTSGNSGNITINFLLADANNDPCNIEVAYSTNGGSTFTPTISLTGSTTAVLPGNRNITWNSAADISGNQSSVMLRITPADAGGSGTAAMSQIFAVSNNDLPVVSAVSAAGFSGNITLTYALTDPNNDLCSIAVFYSVDGGTTYSATTNVTGVLTSVAPGSGKTLTWNSATDIPGNQSAVRVRIVANDGSGAGTPGESSVFAISNNTLPVVNNVITSGNSGNITINFQLVDTNNEPCNIEMAYSTNGGSTFTATANVTGSTTAVIPGNRNITWNSAADISGNQSSVIVRITPADAVGSGTAGVSSAFAVSNNDLPAISAVTTSGSSGDITITYSLADPNNDPCTISVFYSIDNGTTFLPASGITGPLAGVTSGIGKTLTWDSRANVSGNQSNVKIRLVANDGSGAGTPGDSASFAISNNTLPVVSNVVASGTTGNFTLIFELTDANNDPCNVTVAYSIDGGVNFTRTSNVTGKTSGILSGVASLTWNSAADINGNEGNVRIRITPSDAVGSGTAGVSPVFAVSNNNLPVVSGVTTSGSSGNITITYNLTDPNNDACNITVYYSTDDGVNYLPTTNLTGSLTGVTPGSGQTLVWNSSADVNGNSSTVRIKVGASDGAGEGTPGESPAFAISNNTLPVVSAVTTSGSVGNITVSFLLTDANNHPCSIGVFYSTDGGTNYTATSNITGQTTEIAPGNRTITWNSAADINGNQNNVRIRIVPNDGVGDGTAGISPVFAVTNNNLPSVSNVATSGTSGNIAITYTLADPNNDPCNITVFYSIDNGVNYTQTTNISGQTSNVLPGTGKTLTWNSVADVNTNASSVKIKIAASDSIGNGTPAESAAFSVSNNQLPIVSAVAVSGSSGDITITYTLTDGNNDPCNIGVFFSTNDGSTYTQTTNYTGSATNVLPGTSKTLVWKSVQDVNRNSSTVKIRLVPTDKVGTGTGAESATFAVNNNQLPVVSNVVTSGNSGNIAITFDLADANNDNCRVALAYSIDGGSTFVPAGNVSGTTSGLAPGTGRTLSWNSATDINGSQPDVRVRVQPADTVGSGTAGISAAFAINNNQAPIVTNVTPSGSVGDITITYTLADANNDACSIVVYYSIDGGTNYFQTGNLTGNTTGILPGASRTIVWRSATDIPGTQNNVRVKIMPNDGTVNGTEGQSSIFAVNNNNLPVVSNVTTTGTSGSIQITYSLVDANGDNCSINVYYSIDNGVTYTQTSNLSGTLNNIPPGTGKTVTWNSALDVSGNAQQVRVRVEPADGSGTGTAGDSATFAVNNNSAPVVSNLVTSGSFGDITVSYTLADNENDSCGISLAYSINGGASYTNTSNVTGTVTGVAPGNRSLVWRSVLDVPGDQASVKLRIIANDGSTNSSPAETAVFAVSNSNQPPVISNVTTTGTTGAITVTYTLADPNSDLCSIAVYYSTNGGVNYAHTTNITGQTTDIAPGVRTISWNSPPDINGSIGNVRVKVVPTDRGGPGTGGESPILMVDNIGRPVVSNVTTAGGRGNIVIKYNYSDPNNDIGSLQVYYSLDNGVNFTRTHSLTGQINGFTPGDQREIIWNSAVDVAGGYPEVKVRIMVDDGTGVGTPGTSAAFSLSNDGMPSILRIMNSGSTGQITFSYDLFDPNNDLCSIDFYYSIDGGQNYIKTINLINGLQQEIIPGAGKVITWDSPADVLGYYPNTKIRIIPSDPDGSGIPAESPMFPLRNNRLPVVSGVTTSGNSGDITVEYTLSDADSDSCDVIAEYSINSINWFPTFSITGNTSNLTPGAGKTFVWRSADDFSSTYDQVWFRLIPNDGVGNGTAGMSKPFAVANNSRPSISNVVTSGNTGAITVTFDLADAENNTCAVSFHYSLNGGVSYTQSSFASGDMTNVLPGSGNVIVWESTNNVTANVPDVRVRLVPNDGTGNGTAGVSAPFALNNDTNVAPSITALARSGTAGNINFTYTLADANNDACSVKLYYSLDSGDTYLQSSNTSGATSGVLPGSGRTLVWNSVADVNTNATGVLVRLVPQDNRAEGTGMTTAAFNITNNTLPIINEVAVTGDNGPIPISYTLIDSNADPCNIAVLFSIDGGLTFNSTNNISGSLTGVTPGTSRSLTWNSSADVAANQSGVRIRLVPTDPFGQGSAGETVSFTVNNNKLPVVSSVTTAGNSGDITVTYNLADANSHLCSIQVFYSIDGGVTYMSTDDITGTLADIVPGNGQTFVWHSQSLINRNQTGVRIRVVPSDPYGQGTAANSSSFSVLNNQAPVVSTVTPSGSSGNIVVTYDLADGNSNPCSVLFYYSKDNGSTFTLSTNITGQTANVLPGTDKVLTWNSSADINADNSTVILRIVANDGTVNSAPGDSSVFSVLNNRPSAISNLRTSGSTGDITITYDIEDVNGDLSSVAVAYSINNGLNYTDIDPANLSGSTAGIAPGTNKSIIWNSAANITGNVAAVKIRITPNDGYGAGVAVESAGFAVTNNNLPVVSNVVAAGSSGNISITYDIDDANLNNCSIAVFYSIDNGSNYTQIQSANLSGATSNIAPGTGKVVTWNSLPDIPGAATQVKVKVLPHDGTGTGTPGESSAFAVTNNSLPAVSAVTASVSGSDVTIGYTLADAETDTCSITVYYSTDGGATYTKTTSLTGDTSVVPGNKTIVWNSRNDFLSNSGNIRVKVEPHDGKALGTAGISGTFALANNTMPRVANLVVGGSAGPITITYDLEDDEANACSIEVYYSTNNGISYTRTTSLTGVVSNLSPAAGRTVTWNSGDDFAGKSETVRVRVVANDGFGNSDAGISDAFTLSNNVVPVVSNLVTSGNSGIISLSFSLADANGHTCDLSVDYSTDNGNTWASATGVTGTLVDVAPGSGRTLSWDSRQNFSNNHAEVKLRVTPSDPFEIGTSGVSAAFAVNNNRLPVINNVLVSGSKGDISVSYTLVDQDNDACNVTVARSVNGGIFTPIDVADISGSISSVSPGTGINFVWDSTAVSFSTNVRLRLTPHDGIGNGTPGDSVVFTVNNVNELPIISNISVTQAGKVATFTFDLADANNDTCDITVEYSTNNGITWSAANQVVGDLTGIVPGLTRKITWSNIDDLPGLNNSVKVRLTANDGKASGASGVTSSFIVDNTAPAVSNLRVTRQAGSTFRILYDFSYPSVETTCSAVVFYSANDGPWTQSSQAPVTGLTPGTDREIIWNASAEGLAAGDNFRVRVRVSDSLLNGTSDQSEIFRVNNEPPTVAFTSLTTDPRTANGNYSGNLAASFTITDLTPNNSYSVSVEYTTNAGETWAPATADRPLVFNAPGNYEFIWESFHDYQSDSINDGAILRIKCSDGETDSDYDNSSNFTLKNTHLPSITGRFVKADATISSFAALDDTGRLYVWGQNSTFDIGAGIGILGVTQAAGELNRSHKDIACTYNGVIALGTDGTIRCVGTHGGEFGNGLVAGSYANSSPAIPAGIEGKIIAVAAGPQHVLALHEDKTIRAFGADNSGQLGDGTASTASSTTPTPVLNLSLVKAIAAGGIIPVTTAGYGHSLAVRDDGTVWAWGGNAQGQLGLNDVTARSVPTEVVWFRNNNITIKAIAAGSAHSLFLSEEGKVYHCGHHTTANSNRLEPAEIEIFDDIGEKVKIVKVFAGGNAAPTTTATTWGTCYAVDAQGNVYVWGNNNTTARHFGLNSADVTITTPTRVPGISRISAIATSKNVSANLRATAYCGNSETGNSSIWTAGSASSGMLGNSSTSPTYHFFLYHQ